MFSLETIKPIYYVQGKLKIMRTFNYRGDGAYESIIPNGLFATRSYVGNYMRFVMAIILDFHLHGYE